MLAEPATIHQRNFAVFQSLVLNAEQVASLFGKSRSWFHSHRHDLETAGFPSRDPLLSGWSSRAISAWFDARESDKAKSTQNPWRLGVSGKEFDNARRPD